VIVVLPLPAEARLCHMSHPGLSAILRPSVVQVYKPCAINKHASIKDDILLVYSIEEMRLQLWYSFGMNDLVG
jgi:hypothetical protein